MDIYMELRQSLKAFMTAAESRDANSIAAVLARIRELVDQLPPDAAPMLRHYLEQRSYQKAMEFLATGESDTESPRCGSR